MAISSIVTGLQEDLSDAESRLELCPPKKPGKSCRKAERREIKSLRRQIEQAQRDAAASGFQEPPDVAPPAFDVSPVSELVPVIGAAQAGIDGRDDESPFLGEGDATLPRGEPDELAALETPAQRVARLEAELAACPSGKSGKSCRKSKTQALKRARKDEQRAHRRDVQEDRFSLQRDLAEGKQSFRESQQEALALLGAEGLEQPNGGGVSLFPFLIAGGALLALVFFLRR